MKLKVNAQIMDEQVRVQGSKKDELQLVMNNIPQAVFWKSKDLVYLGANQAFAEDAGAESSQDLIGKTDYDLAWKKEEADFFRECDRKVMDSGEPIDVRFSDLDRKAPRSFATHSISAAPPHPSPEANGKAAICSRAPSNASTK